MGIFDLFKKEKISEPPKKREAFYGGTYKPLFTYSFDGEKNPGELGPLINWHLDYFSLRKRSWDSYLTSEITQTVVKRFVMWVIGKGLHVQSEPSKSILDSEKVNINTDILKEFIKGTESRFNVYLKSKRGDYCEKTNISQIAETALINAIVGGDVLVVKRIEKGNINIQLIDGSHIMTPSFGNHFNDAKQRGNKIVDGIEIDKRGRHVAYYVKESKDLTVKRVLAKGKASKKEMSFLVTGFKYRIDDCRGIPLLSAILETLKKLDRYKEATVGSAEERAKIPFAIEHDQFSDGENPMAKSMAQAFNVGSEQSIPEDINGVALQNKVAATVDKSVINMPIGAKLKSLESKAEINYAGFYQPNVESVCATFGMPPEVALMKYESNYSSSRAAIKDWEHTINVWRSKFGFQFYQPIFNTWLDLEVLKNKIQAPGYLTALQNNNMDVLEAYRNSRFVGSSVPHIDPLKEVKAERAKLGELGKNIPLTTAESSTEHLDEGDYETNFTKFSQEIKNLKEIEPEEKNSNEPEI